MSRWVNRKCVNGWICMWVSRCTLCGRVGRLDVGGLEIWCQVSE